MQRDEDSAFYASAFPEVDVSAGLTKWEYTVIQLARGAMQGESDFTQVGMSKYCCDFATKLWVEMEKRENVSDD